MFLNYIGKESKEGADSDDKTDTELKNEESSQEEATQKESETREKTQDEAEDNKNEQNGENIEPTVQTTTMNSPISGEQMPISSISGGTRKPSESEGEGHDNKGSKKPEKLELQSTPIPGPVNISILGDSANLTERLERALGSVAPLLREIFVDFAAYLSKTLIGSHGQELLIGGKFFSCMQYKKF